MAQVNATVANNGLSGHGAVKSPPIITTTPVAANNTAAATTSAASMDKLHRLRGLTNLGNTCFFNAVMQCLGQTPFLSTIFKNEVVLPGGNVKIENGEEKNMPAIRIEYYSNVEEIIAAFTDILDELQKPGGVYNPSQFFKRFTTLHPQFGGGDQHDSHELLRHLLDSVIAAERKTYLKWSLRSQFEGRKSKDLSKAELQTLKSYGNQAKDRYLIERVFQGSLESTLQCAVCAHTSPNMEKFLDISLPISVDVPRPSTTVQHAYGRQRSSPEPAPALTKRQLKQEKRKMKREKKYANRADVESCARDKSNENSDNSDSDDENSDNSSTEQDNGKNDSDGDMPKNFVVSLTISRKGGSLLLEKHAADKACSTPHENGFKAAENVPLASNNNNTLTTIVSENNNAVDMTPEIAKSSNADDGTETAATNRTTNASATKEKARDMHPNCTIGPPYVPSEGECSVQSCLSAFTAIELMSGNNKVGCEKCTEKINGKDGKTCNTNATKQFLISSLPAVLILHLKRFQIGPRHSFRKLATQVTFPVTLDIGPFCAASPKISKKYRTVNSKQKKILYSLYGVVEHSGSMHGGHYVAYVKVRSKLTPDDPRWKFVSKLYNEQQRDKSDGDDESVHGNGYDSDDSVTSWPDEENITAPPGQWYYVSDSKVQEVTEERVLNTQAYLLFYERIY